MKSKILINITLCALALTSFLAVEAGPFSRLTSHSSKNYRAIENYKTLEVDTAPIGVNTSCVDSNSSPIDPYTYDYDNARPMYQKRPYDTGIYCYDQAGTCAAGRMNRYNGYYNTSFLAGTYTSGVSSYPGTTTGPGISNGYHGTPKGIYFTDSRYYDRNIRVNPDIYYQGRR
ncbi:MAG: hypothetical protein H0V82_03910 [Candidatus Protochlamydia sp.]|nr:hypothetical protein [Candidatus Protochlamydia sp.]